MEEQGLEPRSILILDVQGRGNTGMKGLEGSLKQGAGDKVAC